MRAGDGTIVELTWSSRANFCPVFTFVWRATFPNENKQKRLYVLVKSDTAGLLENAMTSSILTIFKENI
jgi:hypothetical protein